MRTFLLTIFWITTLGSVIQLLIMASASWIIFSGAYSFIDLDINVFITQYIPMFIGINLGIFGRQKYACEADSHLERQRPVVLGNHDPDYLPVQPGPRTTRPGVAPVCSPSFSTCLPLTNTCSIPVEYWCGSTKVA